MSSYNIDGIVQRARELAFSFVPGAKLSADGKLAQVYGFRGHSDSDPKGDPHSDISECNPSRYEPPPKPKSNLKTKPKSDKTAKFSKQKKILDGKLYMTSYNETTH
jgi:hypothetical protein